VLALDLHSWDICRQPDQSSCKFYANALTFRRFKKFKEINESPTRYWNSVVNAFKNTDFFAFPQAENFSLHTGSRVHLCSICLPSSIDRRTTPTMKLCETCELREVTCRIDRAKSSFWIWSSARGEICKFGATKHERSRISVLCKSATCMANAFPNEFRIRITEKRFLLYITYGYCSLKI